MPETSNATLAKAERISGRNNIEQLFSAPKKTSFTAYPIRVVWTTTAKTDSQPQARMLVSVPKRCFKHAVDRNRVKRQLREAYRKNKQLLIAPLANQQPHTAVSAAFIWLSDKQIGTRETEQRMKNLLQRIAESL